MDNWKVKPIEIISVIVFFILLHLFCSESIIKRQDISNPEMRDQLSMLFDEYQHVFEVK